MIFFLYDNVLFYRNRVVIPEMLRKHIMDIVHDGYKGIVAMKAEASLWFISLTLIKI